MAVGAALAFRVRGEPRVALGWIGDGSSANGTAHESMNFAGVRRLPVVFVIDNNQFAYSTPTHLNFASSSLAARGPAYGFEGVVVDGTDVLAVYREAQTAIERARSGGGPTVLELMTLRMEGHAVHDDGAYVPPELYERWGEQDPVRRFEAWMREHAELSDERALGAGARGRGCDRRCRRARRGEPVARSRHARGWRLRRLKEERARKLLALPRYRPWFYDLVRGTSALLLRSLFRLRTEGLENVPVEGGVVLAPMHRSYIDTLAVGVSLRRRRFRAMAKYELFFVPVIGRAIALGGGFPVRRGVQDNEAYETAMGLLRDGDMLLVFPRAPATATARRVPSWARRGSRSRRGRRSCPSRSPAATASSCSRRASRRISVYYGEPIPIVRPAGGRSAARVACGDEALVGGRRRRPRDPRARSGSRVAQAARWSSRRWRCSCSQAWCHARTRAA